MTLFDWRNKYGMAAFDALAKMIPTSQNYLTQIIYGYRRPSLSVALRIEECSHGEISAHEMRPDIIDEPINFSQKLYAAGFERYTFYAHPEDQDLILQFSKRLEDQRKTENLINNESNEG